MNFFKTKNQSELNFKGNHRKTTQIEIYQTKKINKWLRLNAWLISRNSTSHYCLSVRLCKSNFSHVVSIEIWIREMRFHLISFTFIFNVSNHRSMGLLFKYLYLTIDYLIFHNSVESPIFIWFASPLHFYVNLKLISMMEIPFELSWFCFVVVFHLSYLCQVYYPLLNIFKFCFRY